MKATSIVIKLNLIIPRNGNILDPLDRTTPLLIKNLKLTTHLTFKNLTNNPLLVNISTLNSIVIGGFTHASSFAPPTLTSPDIRYSLPPTNRGIFHTIQFSEPTYFAL
jgi:hypothetical protein